MKRRLVLVAIALAVAGCKEKTDEANPMETDVGAQTNSVSITIPTQVQSPTNVNEVRPTNRP